jgi:hypothetical protein
VAYKIESFTVRPADTTGGNKSVASDGYSIWISNAQQGGSPKGYITRLRLSDGAYLNWYTGAVDTQANATNTSFTGAFPYGTYPGAMVALNGILWVCVQGDAYDRFVRGYTIATGAMTYNFNVSVISGGAIPGQYAYAGGTQGVVCGGAVYFPTLGGPWAGNTYSCVLKVTPAGVTLFRFGDAYSGTANWLATDGVSTLWMGTSRISGSKAGLLAFNTSGTVLGFADGGTGNNPAGVKYDGAGTIWFGYSSYLTRIRTSDLYWLQPNGTAQAVWSSACSYPTPEGAASYTVCVEWDGTHAWSGGGAPKPWSLLPTSGIWNVIANCGANSPWSYFDGTWVWFGDYSGPLVYRIHAEVPLITPNLTAVTPSTGPRVSLTFDNPIGVVGPTIGPASSGLGILGVNQVDARHLDLLTDYPPIHPLGEADELPGPAPTPPVRTW